MQRQPGDGLFVWYDLMSNDPAAADVFYRALFGWEMETEPRMTNGYRELAQNGVAFGGVLPWDASIGPSSWMGYIQVSDLDARVGQVERLDGTVHVGITDIPGAGRVAIVADPTGAPFFLFGPLPKRRASASLYNRGDGFPIWNELITTDATTAIDYYDALLDWDLTTVDGNGNPYTVAKADDVATAGLFQPETSPAHSAWIVSFQTSDIDATIAQVQKLGGKVIHPVNDAPGIGRTAWVADPTSAVFGLMQPEAGWLDRL